MTVDITKKIKRRQAREARKGTLSSVEAAGHQSSRLLELHLKQQNMESIAAQREYIQVEGDMLTEAQTKWGEEFANRLAQIHSRAMAAHVAWTSAMAKALILERAVSMLAGINDPAARLIVAAAVIELLHLPEVGAVQSPNRGN